MLFIFMISKSILRKKLYNWINVLNFQSWQKQQCFTYSPAIPFFCIAIVSKDQTNFLETLGQFKDDYIDVCKIKTMIGKYRISKYQWVSTARQVLEGISFLHQLTLLHNDIRADNVILLEEFRKAVNSIDFGKSLKKWNTTNIIDILHMSFETRQIHISLFWQILTHLVICFTWWVHLKSLIFLKMWVNKWKVEAQ